MIKPTKYNTAINHNHVTSKRDFLHKLWGEFNVISGNRFVYKVKNKAPVNCFTRACFGVG